MTQVAFHDPSLQHELLDKLNPQQREAVITTDGPLLVVAGAGSGKTRVITHRIAWLIRECGVAPWEIFAATFTNKAAEEMRERIARVVPGADVARLSIATFHSLCVGILRREAHHAGLSQRFTICDDTDQIALIKDCLRHLDMPASIVRPEQVKHFIAAAKILMLDPEAARREMATDDAPICAPVYARYQERLRAGDAVDFDDLILEVVRIFKTHPEVLQKYHERWRYVMIDEYQDTNRVQFELVNLLAQGAGNICAVGDEDQSIYSWRGAEIENLLKFPEQFPGTRIVRLEQNYRSRETILHAASAVISNNRQRLGKELWSERGTGEPLTMIVGYNEREEAQMVVDTIGWMHRLQKRPYRDMAIFYRNNALSRSFEDQLRQSGIPYRVIGGIKFYERAEVKDLLCYLRLIVNPRDGVALSRIINKPARGIGEKSLQSLFGSAVQAGVSLWDRLMLASQSDSKTDGEGLSRKARAGMLNLVRLVGEWRDFSEVHAPHETLLRVLADTGYEASIGAGDDIDTMSRRENVGELVTALEQYHEGAPGKSLEDFLEEMALRSAADSVTDEDCVSLMTVHCAKGLEYGAVFIVAMEDPIFPSGRSINESRSLEEERRLFYVAITRARDLLFLTRADSRMYYGRPAYNVPSLFLKEIPGEFLRTLDDAKRQWSDVRGGSGLTNNQITPRRNSEADVAAIINGEPVIDVYADIKQPSRPKLAERRAVFADGAVPGTGSKPEATAASAAALAAANDVPGRFASGERVRHARLGEGSVLSGSGAGERRKIVVAFDAGFQMEILERFGGLEPVASGDLPF